jgi:hypothetical protein
MDHLQAVVAFQSWLWLGVFLTIVYWPWQKLCLDYARDKIFEQRDKIFDLAVSGGLAFGSDQYEMIRSTMNAMIRLAHYVTFPRLFLTYLVILRASNAESRDSIRDSIRTIEDNRVRDQVMGAFTKAEKALVFAMVFRSPLFFILSPIFLIFLIFAVPLLLFRGIAASWARITQLAARPIEAAIGNEVMEGT